MSVIFNFLEQFDEILWTYISVPAIMTIGLFLTFKFKFAQLTKAKEIFGSCFKSGSKNETQTDSRGVKPLQAFFTSIGGCIGIGNVVAVCTAIQIGGPGALVWMWIAAFLGMIIKYSEVYLGVSMRVSNKYGSFDGGPMYYLQKVFKTPAIPMLVSVFLAVYGTEIYMFSVVTESLVVNWSVNRWVVIALLLSLIIFTSSGGISRVGSVCSVLIPFFLVLYVGMSAWVLFVHASNILPSLQLILQSAFTGPAAIGGAAGGSILITIYQGMARGCYSGDIGIGYAAVVHAETSLQDPKRQARYAILGVFIDTFIVCTATALVVVSSGVWNEDIPASQLVQVALDRQFPFMEYFMPIFIFLLGYSSMIAFFVVGLKCADYISPRWGRKFYYVFASSAFVFFSFLEQSKALTVMSIVGALLLLINLYGIYRLRAKVQF